MFILDNLNFTPYYTLNISETLATVLTVLGLCLLIPIVLALLYLIVKSIIIGIKEKE